VILVKKNCSASWVGQDQDPPRGSVRVRSNVKVQVNDAKTVSASFQIFFWRGYLRGDIS